MQAWKGESHLSDVLAEQERSIPQNFPGFVQPQYTDDPQCSRAVSLRTIADSLDTLVYHLCLREVEASWVDQLKDYVQQLLGLAPARSPEEQFNHLYTFRKWLFCIPNALLKSDTRDYQTLIILAYYYATALQLEPLYPNVAGAFCSSIVIKPLEEIFKSFAALQQSALYANSHTDTLLSLLAYPKQILNSYNERRVRSSQGRGRSGMPIQNFDRYSSELANTYEDYRFGSHDSPCFPPMARQISQASAVSSIGGIGTPFLEVPGFNWDDSTGASSVSNGSGSIHQRHSSSYTFPSMSSGSYDAEDIFSYDSRAGSVDFKFTKDPLDFGLGETPPLWA